MPFTIIFLFTFTFPQVSFSQPVDTLEAHHFWNTGKQWYAEKNYDSAARYFDRARAIFGKAGWPVREGDCLLNKGNCLLWEKKYHQALEVYAQCINKFSEVLPEDHILFAYPINNMGRVYHELGELFKAREYIEKAAAIRLAYYDEDHVMTAISYYNLGGQSMGFGDYRKALEYFLKALPVYVKNYGDSHPSISSLYINMGILYDKMGDVSHAIDYYLKSIEIDIKEQGESYWMLTYSYVNLGISYYNLGADSLAQVYFEKSIALGKANQLYELYANAYYELGNLQARKQNHGQALRLYQQAVEIITDHLGGNHPRLNYFFAAISFVQQKEGNYPEAEAYLEKAIANVVTTLGELHPRLGRNYQKLAALYKTQGKYPQAHETIAKGFAAISREQIAFDAASLSFNTVSDLKVLLELLLEKASMLEAEYLHTPANIHLLHSALDYYQRSGALIDHIRRGYMAETSKILLQKDAVQVYEKAIHLCKELYTFTDSLKYLALAFQCSEKNKATILAETLQAAELTQLQGIPQELLQEEKALKQKIAFAEQQLIDHPADTVISREVFYFKWQYDSLAKKIADQYPHYYDLKYNLEVVSVKDVQQTLTNKKAVLSYFEGDSVWYVFCITHNAITLQEVNKLHLSQDDLKDFRDAVSNSQSEYAAYSEVSYSIYEQLVKKPLEGKHTVRQLIIVPDGILGHIPFDALISQPFEEGTNKPHYLIEDYTLTYANSMTLLSQSVTRVPKPQMNYAGFAPEYPENLVASHEDLGAYRDILSQLSGTQEEVSFAGAIFSGITFLAQQATEYNFKNLKHSPAILHLAMHALIDDQDPIRSRLLFTHVSDSVEDGSLHAYEIYNLRFSTNLAVLSACNTGYGVVHRGEGIMSLSRAFMYAGCPSIVMSLWRAKDQPTTQIIRSFFENLKAELPKDEALRQAKLTYLRQADPLKAHPAHWATFVLFGNAEPVMVPSNTYTGWMAGIILFFMASGTFFYFYKKK